MAAAFLPPARKYQGSPAFSLVRFALVACVLFTVAFPRAMWADRLPVYVDDVPPKFSDPEVIAYAAMLKVFSKRYIVAAIAARHGGDAGAMKRLDAQLPELEDQAISLVAKLKPSEIERFTEYVSACGEMMRDAAYGLGPWRGT
jgi:hypothetical protein